EAEAHRVQGVVEGRCGALTDVRKVAVGVWRAERTGRAGGQRDAERRGQGGDVGVPARQINGTDAGPLPEVTAVNQLDVKELRGASGVEKPWRQHEHRRGDRRRPAAD